MVPRFFCAFRSYGSLPTSSILVLAYVASTYLWLVMLAVVTTLPQAGLAWQAWRELLRLSDSFREVCLTIRHVNLSVVENVKAYIVATSLNCL